MLHVIKNTLEALHKMFFFSLSVTKTAKAARKKIQNLISFKKCMRFKYQ